MRILITGGTGYIGKRLVSCAIRGGHEVSVFSRHRPAAFDGSWFLYDLKEPYHIDFPRNVDVVIHLAANTSGSDDVDSTCEIVASRRLLRLAKVRGARFIFVSSQTAAMDAPTAYGRSKWAIEQLVAGYGGTIVRPGQVYGGERRGVFGNLVRLTEKLPVLPAFIPSPMVQPIHLDDLCGGLLHIAAADHFKSRVFCLAAAEPCSFTQFLSLIANKRLRKRGLFIPLPTFLITALSSIISSSVEKRTGITQLRSLFRLPAMRTADDLKEIGLVLRQTESGMHSSGNDQTRLLMLEGRAFLSYVLKQPPTITTLARYVRVVRQLRNGAALGLPDALTKFPILISALDDAKRFPEKELDEFRWRLDAATLIAECTPLGAERYLGKYTKTRISKVIIGIVVLLIQDCAWRVIWLIGRGVTNHWISRLVAKP